MTTRGVVFWVVLFALTLGTYVLTGRLAREQGRLAEEAKRVFDFEPQDITTLSLEREDGSTVEAMRKNGEQWSIVMPYPHIPASQNAWDALAGAVASLKNERSLDVHPADLAHYGLESPQATVVVGTSSGELRQIEVGAPDPAQAHFYMRVGSGDVFLAKVASIVPFDQSLSDLRDKRIVTLADREISRIAYTGGFESGRQGLFTVAFEREDDASWSMVSPIRAEPDMRKLSALAIELMRASSREHIDDPKTLDVYGLSPPFATIQVQSGDDSETLILGWVSAGENTSSSGIFAKQQGQPTVFVMDSHILVLVPNGVDDFREKRVFTKKAEQLATLKYASRANTFELTSDPNTGWSFVEPPYATIDQFAVSSYIGIMKRIQGLSFPDPADAIGLAPPNVAIDFGFADGSPPTRIEIGGAVPGSDPLVFYARQDNGSVITLPFEAVMALRAKAIEFRNRDLLSYRVTDVRELDLQFEGRRYRFSKSDRGWELLEPDNYILQSQADVDALLELFNAVKAVAIEDLPPAPRSQGMDDPLLAATLTLTASGDESAVTTLGPLLVGSRKSEDSRERFATVEGRPEVFYVDQSLIDDIRSTLRGIVPRS